MKLKHQQSAANRHQNAELLLSLKVLIYSYLLTDLCTAKQRYHFVWHVVIITSLWLAAKGFLITLSSTLFLDLDEAL